MRKFTYFPNHGDENGKREWTICYGNYNDDDCVIVTAVDTKKEAIITCRNLNKEIVKPRKEICAEGKRLMVRLLPPKEYGENEDAERLWDILDMLEGKKRLEV